MACVERYAWAAVLQTIGEVSVGGVVIVFGLQLLFLVWLVNWVTGKIIPAVRRLVERIGDSCSLNRRSEDVVFWTSGDACSCTVQHSAN